MTCGARLGYVEMIHHKLSPGITWLDSVPSTKILSMPCSPPSNSKRVSKIYAHQESDNHFLCGD